MFSRFYAQVHRDVTYHNATENEVHYINDFADGETRACGRNYFKFYESDFKRPIISASRPRVYPQVTKAKGRNRFFALEKLMCNYNAVY